MAAMELQRQWDIEDRDEARAYSRQVYSQLVEDAEAAGFNPLTALRNGGGANYNAAAGMAPLSRKAPVRQAVGGSPLGDAVSQFGRDFMAEFDPYRDQKREQEYRLIESQIASLNAGTLSRVPSGSGRRRYATSDFEARPSGKAAALGKPSKWQEGDVTVTNPWQSWEVDPNVSDGQTIESRLGESELISGAYGLYVLGKDAGWNLDKWAKKRWRVHQGLSRIDPGGMSGGNGW